MTENDMERRVGNLETKVSVIETKVDMFIEETRRANAEFKEEMRQQNEMRANEIMEMRAKHDADMKEFREDLKNTSREIRALLITFVGIVVAILIGMFWNNAPEKNPEYSSRQQTRLGQIEMTEQTTQPVENNGR